MRSEPNALDLPLPDELRQALRVSSPHAGQDETWPRPGPQDNLGLWLDKLVPCVVGEASLKERDRLRVFATYTRELWRSAGAAEALARLERSARDLAGERLVRSIDVKTVGHFLVDHGRPSPIETNLSFDFVHGAPRIPGSALKGVLRSAILSALPQRVRDELARVLVDARPRALSGHLAALRESDPDAWRFAELLVALGTPRRRGRLVLFDALPREGAFRLATDVLTPHFGPYYQDDSGREPPADWHSPVPHTFLTVVDTVFRCLIALMPPDGPDPPDGRVDQDLLDHVDLCLRAALAQFGVGARTSAGYGRLV